MPLVMYAVSQTARFRVSNNDGMHHRVRVILVSGHVCALPLHESMLGRVGELESEREREREREQQTLHAENQQQQWLRACMNLFECSGACISVILHEIRDGLFCKAGETCANINTLIFESKAVCMCVCMCVCARARTSLRMHA